MRARATADPAHDRDYVLAATKELQALGIRDQDLQVLAERLKGVASEFGGALAAAAHF